MEKIFWYGHACLYCYDLNPIKGGSLKSMEK